MNFHGSFSWQYSRQCFLPNRKASAVRLVFRVGTEKGCQNLVYKTAVTSESYTMHMSTNIVFPEVRQCSWLKASRCTEYCPDAQIHWLHQERKLPVFLFVWFSVESVFDRQLCEICDCIRVFSEGEGRMNLPSPVVAMIYLSPCAPPVHCVGAVESASASRSAAG